LWQEGAGDMTWSHTGDGSLWDTLNAYMEISEWKLCIELIHVNKIRKNWLTWSFCLLYTEKFKSPHSPEYVYRGWHLLQFSHEKEILYHTSLMEKYLTNINNYHKYSSINKISYLTIIIYEILLEKKPITIIK
jgi:hypothetical protein